MLAALAGAAMTIVARGDLARGDLANNLGAAAGAAGYARLGALIVRRAGNVIGWIMLGMAAALAFLALASAYAVAGIATIPGSFPAARLVGTLAQGSFAPVLFAIGFMVPLFPAGTLPSRRWRPVAVAGLVLAGLATAGLVVHPGPVGLPAPGGVSLSIPNPLGVANPGPVLRTLLIGTFPGLVGALAPFLAAALVLLAVRYRAGGQLLRQQVKWLALIAVVIVVAVLFVLLGTAAGHSWDWLVTTAYTVAEVSCLFGIPAAMTIAILRHRLYDIDRIISRTLAYAIVTGVLVGLYAGWCCWPPRCCGSTARLRWPPPRWPPRRCSNPLRRRVQRVVDRRFNRAPVRRGGDRGGLRGASERRRGPGLAPG